MTASEHQEGRLALLKEFMARHGHLSENDAFCDGPATVFSDESGSWHWWPWEVEILHQRRCITFEGDKPRRIARLCS